MGGQEGVQSWYRSAPACYGSSLGSNPDISQKYKIGDISKGVANTLACQKIVVLYVCIVRTKFHRKYSLVNLRVLYRRFTNTLKNMSIKQLTILNILSKALKMDFSAICY